MSYNNDYEQARSRKPKTFKKHHKGNRNHSYDNEDLMFLDRKNWRQIAKQF